MQTIFGRIRWCTTSDRPEVWPWGGDPIPVQPTDAPLEKSLEIVLAGDVVVDWRLDDRLAEEQRADRDIALVLVRPEPRDDDQKKVDAAARHLQQAYRRYYHGRIGFRVKGYVVAGPSFSDVRNVDFRLVRDAVAEQNPMHRHTHWHVWSGKGANGICGNAWNGGTQAYTSLDCPPSTHVHEHGHNEGLGHGGADAGYAPGYADPISWMGNRQKRHRHSAPHLNHLGVLDDVSVHPEGETARYWLVDSEARSLAVRPGETQLVLVSRDRDQNYAIGLAGDRVYIYRTNPAISKRWSGTWVVGVARPGSTVEAGDVLVEHVQHTDGASEVVVKWSAGQPDPAPIDPPQVVLPENAVRPTPGLWQTVEHQGLHMQVDGDKIRGIWFTFDRNERTRFYRFSGALRNNIAHIEIDGNKGILYCTSDTDGVLKAVVDGQRVAIRIRRVTTPIEARMLEASETEGVCYSRNDTPHGEVKIGLWYRTERVNAVTTREEWLLIDGRDVYRPLYGDFNLPADSELKHIGVVDLTPTRINGTVDGQSVDRRLSDDQAVGQ